MNKYYTPKIEEFYYGLEYEILDECINDRYENEFYNKKDFLGRDIKYPGKKGFYSNGKSYETRAEYAYQVINKGWFKKTFGANSVVPTRQVLYKKGIVEYSLYGYRVKYLDDGDIESLGFNISISTSNKVFIKHFDRMTINITILKNSYIYIDYINDNSEEGRLFRGYVKNKSALKVLLKQLNIDDSTRSL